MPLAVLALVSLAPGHLGRVEQPWLQAWLPTLGSAAQEGSCDEEQTGDDSWLMRRKRGVTGKGDMEIRSSFSSLCRVLALV